MKKLLVFMTALTLLLGLTACQGESNAPPTSDAAHLTSATNTSDSIDLTEITGNGLVLALPTNFQYAQTNETTGEISFADENGTAVVTLGVKTEDSITSTDITDEVILAALGGESNATLDSSETMEHEDGTSVVGFGKVTLEDGMVMNGVLQFFFPTEGGSYYAICYLYDVDAESSLENMIEQVLPTVKVEKE